MTSTRRLPLPHTNVYDWQRNAACRTVNSTLFFGPVGEGRGARQQREERAKAICVDCPVQLACRQHALDAAEPYGVWGGLSPEERHVERRSSAREGRSAQPVPKSISQVRSS